MIDQWGVFAPNATRPRWGPMALPWYGHISLANGTMFRVFIAVVARANTPDLDHIGRRLFVGIEYVGAFAFDWPEGRAGRLFPSYVEEKLGVPEADAQPLADLINTIFGITTEKDFADYSEVETWAARS